MKITYTGEGASVEEPRVWSFKPTRLMSAEAEAIEKVTGMDYTDEFLKKIPKNMLATRALIWVLRKRTEPTLRFTEVSFCMDDLEFGFDDEELGDIAASLDTMAEDQRAVGQQLLDASGWVAPEPGPTAAPDTGSS